MTTSDGLDTATCLPGVKTLLVQLAALGKALMLLRLESCAHLSLSTALPPRPAPNQGRFWKQGVGLHLGEKIFSTVNPLHVLNEPSFPILLQPAWLSGVTSR